MLRFIAACSVIIPPKIASMFVLPPAYMRRLTSSLAVALCTAVGLSCFLSAPKATAMDQNPYPIFSWSSPWVQAHLDSMSLDQMIGQLFMVGVYSEQGAGHAAYIERLVRDYHIGGLIFMKGKAKEQLRLTRRFQQTAALPLLIAMDAEWGPAMRLAEVPSWPRQMTLGAQPHTHLSRRMGRAMARQLKALGVHVNFAPVVDINSNPRNPVIHTRSFGGDPVLVSMHGRALMQGLQSEHVLAVAKHFPGHGDTQVDSHKDLPVIDKSYNQLLENELYPFNQLFRAGVGGVMTAHLHLPQLDDRPQRAGSLSERVVSGMLRDSMGYNGLVFSDALNMKGVSKYFEPGEVELEALLAGNDVLLYPEDVPKAVQMIEEAVQNGRISRARLRASVRRILQVKAWCGLDTLQPGKIRYTDRTDSLLWNSSYQGLKRNIIRKAISVPLDTGGLLPIPSGYPGQVLSLAIDAEAENMFQKRLHSYMPVETAQLSSRASASALNAMREQVHQADLIIISLHHLSRYDVDDFGLSWSIRRFINSLERKEHIVLVAFGSPYVLRLFPEYTSIMLGYEPGADYEDLAAQALVGAQPLEGKIPVTVNDRLQLLQGALFSRSWRLQFGLPEELGLSASDLKGIDTIAEEALKMEAAPGFQVVVAKDNMIIYQKNFGHHTYEEHVAVRDTSIYDLASITKVAATMLPVMRFYELGLFQPEQKLGQSLPRLQGSNKAGLKWREVLTHQSGLQAWIPFYRYTLNEEGLADSNYCYAPNSFFQVEVADGLYAHPGLHDTIFEIIDSSDLRQRGEYLYSDLGFLYLKEWVEQYLRVPFEDYLKREFYRKMDLQHTLFRPLEAYPRSAIVPTEYDDYFRQQLVHGHVHDPAAAMLGGVAGHAGLFSTATEMTALMQMLLNGGHYGGHRFFMPSTISTFTSQQFTGNRKGMGFDKPEMDPNKVSPAAPSASGEAFGHTGFTGTCAWADPHDNMVFIFLSNRVHPDAGNYKLVHEDIRTRMQEVAYQAVRKAPVSAAPQ